MKDMLYGLLALVGLAIAAWGAWKARQRAAVAKMEAKQAELDKIVAEKISELSVMSDIEIKEEFERLIGGGGE